MNLNVSVSFSYPPLFLPLFPHQPPTEITLYVLCRANKQSLGAFDVDPHDESIMVLRGMLRVSQFCGDFPARHMDYFPHGATGVEDCG